LIDVAALLQGDGNPMLLADPDGIVFNVICCLATHSLGSAGCDGNRVCLFFL
jgi:hypothetical protein